MAEALAGQVAIVTGGGRGIGRAIAEALAAAGAAVTITARSADQLDETAEGIKIAGGRVLAIPADVTDRAAVERVVAETEKQLGPITLLVNNAGASGTAGLLWEVDPDEWWDAMAVNLRGPFAFCRAVLPTMVAHGRGRIINVASLAGVISVHYASAYMTSKTALVRLSECLALETAEYGVSVFVIDPGGVSTVMTTNFFCSPSGRAWLPEYGKNLAATAERPA